MTCRSGARCAVIGGACGGGPGRAPAARGPRSRDTGPAANAERLPASILPPRRRGPRARLPPHARGRANPRQRLRWYVRDIMRRGRRAVGAFALRAARTGAAGADALRLERLGLRRRSWWAGTHYTTASTPGYVFTSRHRHHRAREWCAEPPARPRAGSRLLDLDDIRVCITPRQNRRASWPISTSRPHRARIAASRDHGLTGFNHHLTTRRPDGFCPSPTLRIVRAPAGEIAGEIGMSGRPPARDDSIGHGPSTRPRADSAVTAARVAAMLEGARHAGGGPWQFRPARGGSRGSAAPRRLEALAHS